MQKNGNEISYLLANYKRIGFRKHRIRTANDPAARAEKRRDVQRRINQSGAVSATNGHGCLWYLNDRFSSAD